MKRKLEQIRLHNLELLIAEAGSAAELARIVGTNSSYLSQVRRQMPTQKGTPRSVGDDLADKLERGMDKPEGWMDGVRCQIREPETLGKYEARKPGSIIRDAYPLISWVQAGEWTEIAEGYVPEYGSELYPCPVNCSEETFVLRVRGVSMEPKFHEGDLIFVDPNVDPLHGKYIVVQLEEPNEATFKQLIIEGDKQYLKALNPDWPKPIIEVDTAATICGVVVFKGEVV